MLLGTELDEAYDFAPANLGTNQSTRGVSEQQPSTVGRPSIPNVSQQFNVQTQQKQQSAQPAMSQPIVKQSAVAIQPSTVPTKEQTPPPVYDANFYNQQYNMEQTAMRQAYLDQQYRLAQAQAIANSYRQASNKSADANDMSTGYFDVLGSKKKDMLKLVVLSMMILLALSLHSLVSFCMKDFIAASDITFRQEVGIRALYPLIVLFLLWNLKAMR